MFTLETMSLEMYHVVYAKGSTFQNVNLTKWQCLFTAEIIYGNLRMDIAIFMLRLK